MWFISSCMHMHNTIQMCILILYTYIKLLYIMKIIPRYSWVWSRVDRMGKWTQTLRPHLPKGTKIHKKGHQSFSHQCTWTCRILHAQTCAMWCAFLSHSLMFGWSHAKYCWIMNLSNSLPLTTFISPALSTSCTKWCIIIWWFLLYAELVMLAISRNKLQKRL